MNSTTPTASGLAFGEISNEVEVTPDGGGQDRIVITTAGVATDTLLANGPSDEFDPGARFTVSILHQTPDVVGDVTILPARFGSSD